MNNRQSKSSIPNRQSVNRQSAIGSRQSGIIAPMDPEYKKMMTWLLIALVGSVLAAIVVVELVLRQWPE